MRSVRHPRAHFVSAPGRSRALAPASGSRAAASGVPSPRRARGGRRAGATGPHERRAAERRNPARTRDRPASGPRRVTGMPWCEAMSCRRACWSGERERRDRAGRVGRTVTSKLSRPSHAHKPDVTRGRGSDGSATRPAPARLDGGRGSEPPSGGFVVPDRVDAAVQRMQPPVAHPDRARAVRDKPAGPQLVERRARPSSRAATRATSAQSGRLATVISTAPTNSTRAAGGDAMRERWRRRVTKQRESVTASCRRRAVAVRTMAALSRRALLRARHQPSLRARGARAARPARPARGARPAATSPADTRPTRSPVARRLRRGLHASVDLFGERTAPAAARAVARDYARCARRCPPAPRRAPGCRSTSPTSRSTPRLLDADRRGRPARPAAAGRRRGGRAWPTGCSTLVVGAARAGPPVEATLQANLRRSPRTRSGSPRPACPSGSSRAPTSSAADALPWGAPTDAAYVALAHRLHAAGAGIALATHDARAARPAARPTARTPAASCCSASARPTPSRSPRRPRRPRLRPLRRALVPLLHAPPRRGAGRLRTTEARSGRAFGRAGARVR